MSSEQEAPWPELPWPDVIDGFRVACFALSPEILRERDS